MIYDIRSSQYAFTHQIWNSYLKEYRRHALDSMQFLETRSEVKMHPHILFGIPTSKNIGDMHRTRSGKDGLTDIVITIKTKQEVKVKVKVTHK